MEKTELIESLPANGKNTGIMSYTCLRKIRLAYKKNPEMAGKMAISFIEQVFLGDYSFKGEYEIDSAMLGFDEFAEKNREKWDVKVEAEKQEKIVKFELDKIADLLNLGVKKIDICKKLNKPISRPTLDKRIELIHIEFPHLLKENAYKNTKNIKNVNNVNECKETEILQVYNFTKSNKNVKENCKNVNENDKCKDVSNPEVYKDLQSLQNSLQIYMDGEEENKESIENCKENCKNVNDVNECKHYEYEYEYDNEYTELLGVIWNTFTGRNACQVLHEDGEYKYVIWDNGKYKIKYFDF